MARLLACNGCGVLYRLRDFQGPVENDMELREIVDRHMGQAQDKDPEHHRANLFYVDDEDAKLIDVESQLQKDLQDVRVFIRDTRDELKVDALKCYGRHNRPKGGCPDWKDTSKIIGRKSGVAREDLQYLCQFCPVNSHVEFKERQKRGMYK